LESTGFFSRDASQFANGSSTQMWLDEVVHKTYVECDVTDSEAICGGASTPKESVNMQVSRPFIFVICDDINTILFIGVINTPYIE